MEQQYVMVGDVDQNWQTFWCVDAKY